MPLSQGMSGWEVETKRFVQQQDTSEFKKKKKDKIDVDTNINIDTNTQWKINYQTVDIYKPFVSEAKS